MKSPRVPGCPRRRAPLGAGGDEGRVAEHAALVHLRALLEQLPHRGKVVLLDLAGRSGKVEQPDASPKAYKMSSERGPEYR